LITLVVVSGVANSWSANQNFHQFKKIGIYGCV